MVDAAPLLSYSSCSLTNTVTVYKKKCVASLFPACGVKAEQGRVGRTGVMGLMKEMAGVA